MKDLISGEVYLIKDQTGLVITAKYDSDCADGFFSEDNEEYFVDMENVKWALLLKDVLEKFGVE